MIDFTWKLNLIITSEKSWCTFFPLLVSILSKASAFVSSSADEFFAPRRAMDSAVLTLKGETNTFCWPFSNDNRLKRASEKSLMDADRDPGVGRTGSGLICCPSIGTYVTAAKAGDDRMRKRANVVAIRDMMVWSVLVMKTAVRVIPLL